MRAYYDGQTTQAITDTPQNMSHNNLVFPDLEASSATQIVFEDFEGTFVDPGFTEFSSGDYKWGDVPCLSTSGFSGPPFGSRSFWVAGKAGTNSPALNPCSGSNDN